MKPYWKYYEEQTYKVIKQLNPTSSVYQNVIMTGKLSKTPRQVDIQLVNPQDYDFVAFECKNYKVPIDIPRVESFAAKLKTYIQRKALWFLILVIQNQQLDWLKSGRLIYLL